MKGETATAAVSAAIGLPKRFARFCLWGLRGRHLTGHRPTALLGHLTHSAIIHPDLRALRTASSDHQGRRLSYASLTSDF
jgi:hypothetical protein